MTHPPRGRVLAVATLLATALLAGCGQKGALTLPDKRPAAVPATTPTTTSPAH